MNNTELIKELEYAANTGFSLPAIALFVDEIENTQNQGNVI